MPNYTASKKSHAIAEQKLKKILDYNKRLHDQLELQRIPVSEASSNLIEFCRATKDPLIPSVWGPISKDEDPFAPAAGVNGAAGGCCTIM